MKLSKQEVAPQQLQAKASRLTSKAQRRAAAAAAHKPSSLSQHQYEVFVGFTSSSHYVLDLAQLMLADLLPTTLVLYMSLLSVKIEFVKFFHLA